VGVRTRDATRLQALRSELSVERERARRLEAQLRNLADHDPVTDLLNHRSVVHEIDHHLAGCARYGAEGAFLLVGLDGLAAITRAHGQEASDRALAALAEVVADRLRDLDVVGRWGPDELAVLLPRAAEAEVAVVAASLVRLIGEVGAGQAEGGGLTASIGVAAVTDGLVEDSQLVGRARQAMELVRARGGHDWSAATWEAPAT